MANSSPGTPEQTRGKCACTNSAGGTNRIVKWTTAGGFLAAVGVCAACCLLPFALLSLGIAGAWIGALDALAAYKLPLIGLAVTLLGYGFYVAYIRPKRTCAAGLACEACGSSRTVRIGLWIAIILTIGGILFERIEPLLVAH